MLPTEIRISIIAGEKKHVAVMIQDPAAVKAALAGTESQSLLDEVIAFSEGVLANHPDAGKLEITAENAHKHLSTIPVQS